MLSNIYLNSDDKLDDKTILASFSTSRKLRTLLGESEFIVEHHESHSDDVISVGPELYDAFQYYLKYLDARAVCN